MASGSAITANMNREFLFRLQTLIIDGGTEVIRNVFEQRLKNKALKVVLAHEKTIVNRLRGQKTITQAQYDLLYPSGGQPPTVADFDITLIICLLRNLPSLGLNMTYNWHVPPQPTDMSVEADLIRLRGFRNEISHISSTTGFQQASFLAKWIEIEQVLLRLNSASQKPLANLNQIIDSYNNSPIDPSAEQRIQTIIEQWREMERGLETEIVQIKEEVMKMRVDVDDTKHHVVVLKKSIKQELPDLGRHSRSGSLSRISAFFGFGKKDLLKEFQNDLISFYKRQHKSIPLSPLLKEDQPLLDFYVMPDLQSIKVCRSRDGDIEEKTPIRTPRDVFYNDNKLCCNIYLIADAGLGKTAFCKRLALTWSHAQKPDESEEKHFSKDEITAMREFSFVFLVLLRDCSNDCNIDVLIMNQICSQLAHKYNDKLLADILCEETCLIVLDGLDEWTHPLNSCSQRESNIPHQRVRENVAVLTTTRPWKLSVSGLHSSQIDKKLELVGLSDVSAETLKRSVISHLHGEQDENKIDDYETEFNKTVHGKHKSDLTAIPLFLMYFLFLWYYKFNIGKSLADLYSSITELLLSRTLKDDGIRIPKTKTVQSNIPQCFNEHTLCKQFYTLLTSLGKLAFKTLFSATKENTLVFDRSVAEKYLSKDLTFCLKTGIITQSKVQGKSLLGQKTKVSFAHKTVQEFLAALYICSAPNQSSLQDEMLSKCTCVKDILNTSKIFMFIVGIDPKSLVVRKLMNIINEEDITQEYRSSLQDYFLSHPLKDLQDMYISCCKEIPRGIEGNLCLQDVFIERNCKQKEYRENLKRLMTDNKQYIRSVYINMLLMKDTRRNTARKVASYFELSDLINIDKIHYKGEYSDDVILPLLNSSVISLSISCRRLQIWSRSLFDKVTSLQKLEAIRISVFSISHSELKLLFDFISQRDCLEEIELVRLSCTDHRQSSCTGLSLDLTRHTYLRKLTLERLKVAHVTINMTSLQNCDLRYLSNPDLALVFLSCAGNKLNTLDCRSLESPTAVDAVLDTLRLSRHVREVQLSCVDLGTGTLSFSPEFFNIEHLDLYRVTMEASTLRELLDSVLILQQRVTVDIWYCTISQAEFETLKEKIKTSQRVRILNDEWSRFEFETKKDGD